ncbi:MAG: hypothetical protein IPH76_11710 [Xanthomonadales bacterium]|nr:hypothetical protein [Xanthomonadales bacterium]
MNLRIAGIAGIVLGTLFSAGVGAESTHYIVFAGEPGQPAQPVFYARVERAADAAPEPRDDAAELSYRPLRAGVAGAERRVERPLLRAEFARDPEHGDLHLEMRPLPATTENSFLLRLPVAAADAIELDDGRVFDLEALARDAARLPLAGIEAQVELQRAPNTGPPANRVDILVLGDGYTAAQTATFATHAQNLYDAMFNVSPYEDYANLVNWTAGFVTSNQSGADHPPYQAGCGTLACCADSAASTDPFAGQFSDTALDALLHQQHPPPADDQFQQDHGGSRCVRELGPHPGDRERQRVRRRRRQLCGDFGECLGAAGGDPRIRPQLTKLADEYTSAYPGFPACSDITSPPCEANVTNQTTPALIKWAPLLTPAIPIPTPPGTAGTGLFEGARYLTTGMYRPTYSMCLMRSLGSTFCPVCAAAYVKRLYSGGFGAPAAGIDLIEPGTESPPSSGPVAYTAGDSLSVGATVLVPTLGSVTRQWLLDGVEIPGATGSSHVFNQATATPATRTLRLRVTDTTGTLPTSMAGGVLEHTRDWTINISASIGLIFANGFE